MATAEPWAPVVGLSQLAGLQTDSPCCLNGAFQIGCEWRAGPHWQTFSMNNQTPLCSLWKNNQHSNKAVTVRNLRVIGSLESLQN